MFFCFLQLLLCPRWGRTKALNSPGWGGTESVIFARGPRWNTPIQVLFTAKLLFRHAGTLCCGYRAHKTRRLRKEINVTKLRLSSFSIKSVTWIYGRVECIQQRGISTKRQREVTNIVLWPLDNNGFLGFTFNKSSHLVCSHIEGGPPVEIQNALSLRYTQPRPGLRLTARIKKKNNSLENISCRIRHWLWCE